MNKLQCLPSYEFLTSGMPCFLANAVALSWLRAATAWTMTSGCDLAGMISAMGLAVVRVLNQQRYLSPGREPYAMPAAPKTPNLMALLDFSTLGGLKAPQRRLTMDPISFGVGSSLCANGKVGS